MSLTSIIVNKMFADGDRKRDAGLKTPEDVERSDDLSYGKNKRWNTLDVYRPKGVKGKLPVIVSVHGGGWVYGTKEVYQYYGMDLCQRGFAVINFNYRLAPRHRFPAQLEDVCAAFRWVKEHHGEYGFDLDRVYAVGDSAGGHLLALYCCLGTDDDYRRQLGLECPLLPKAVALNCGVYDVREPGKQLRRLLNDLLPGRMDIGLIDPLALINETFPRTFIMSAVADFMKEDAGKLKKVLDEKGVENLYRIYDDAAHELGHVFHVNIRLKEAKLCNDEECAFFLEK